MPPISSIQMPYSPPSPPHIPQSVPPTPPVVSSISTSLSLTPPPMPFDRSDLTSTSPHKAVRPPGICSASQLRLDAVASQSAPTVANAVLVSVDSTQLQILMETCRLAMYATIPVVHARVRPPACSVSPILLVQVQEPANSPPATESTSHLTP